LPFRACRIIAWITGEHLFEDEDGFFTPLRSVQNDKANATTGQTPRQGKRHDKANVTTGQTPRQGKRHDRANATTGQTPRQGKRHDKADVILSEAKNPSLYLPCARAASGMSGPGPIFIYFLYILLDNI
jgi:hypothetical protein